MGETGETTSIEIDCQRLIRETQSIDAHVEFTASEQQRIDDVSLAHVAFYIGIPSCCFPFGNFAYFAEDEDASALALGSGFHDP